MNTTIHLEDVSNHQDDTGTAMSETHASDQGDINDTESATVVDNPAGPSTAAPENVATAQSESNVLVSDDVPDDPVNLGTSPEDITANQSGGNITAHPDHPQNEDGTENGPYEDLSREALLELASRRGLGNTVSEIVRGALIRHDRSTRWWLRAFRIDHLPPELRNLIHTGAMVDERYKLKLSGVNVRGLRRLERDNPEMSHELLGIFLGHNMFELDVEMRPYGPSYGPNHCLADSDQKALDELRPFHRYLRKLLVNLYVEVVPLRERLRVQMTLEWIPTQGQYTVQVDRPWEWGWALGSGRDIPLQGVFDHVQRHAQTYVDNHTNNNFDFTSSGLNRFLRRLPSSYDLPSN
ncbi:hypothetical protein MBLNU457_g0331t1 [Dothideomycetes sp. NU457]